MRTAKSALSDITPSPSTNAISLHYPAPTCVLTPRKMPVNSLVIGASRGLGLSLVKALHSRGDTVFATVRSQPPQDTFPPGTRIIQGVDVGERDAGEKIVHGLAGEKVGLVIVNAGYFKAEVRSSLTSLFTFVVD